VAGRLRRGAPASRPRPEGALPVVLRARGDRARKRPRRVDPLHGEAPRQVAVGGLARAAPNADRRCDGYRATTAHALAYERASRPKPAKLAINEALRAKVEEDLHRRYSPEQIAERLRLEFPDDPQMRVSTETIYQSLYVQSRGSAPGA